MSERYGINNTHLKNRNRGLVLQMIAGNRLSRADITKRIKLTKMTVTNIVGELISEGYIEEKETAETAAVGRNPVMLDIARSAPLAIGIFLSRTKLWVLISDLKLKTVYQNAHMLRNETTGSLTEKLFDLVDTAMAQIPGARILGIGISALGPLDSVTGVILRPTDFFGITNYPIVKLLHDRYALPVFLGNDMNTSALAEKLYGGGVKLTNFLYLGITNGIGSGIISNNRLYQDSSGSVGEIGHMCINFNGEACSCGNHGCLEVYANMPVILEKLRQASGRPGLRCEDFDELRALPACDAIFRDTMNMLAVALVNTVNLLDPQCILVGHEGAFIPPVYLSLLEESVNRHILASGYKQIRIAKSSFGSQAALFGSVCYVFNELFSGHLL